jgi:hypothetical protein
MTRAGSGEKNPRKGTLSNYSSSGQHRMKYRYGSSNTFYTVGFYTVTFYTVKIYTIFFYTVVFYTVTKFIWSLFIR